MARLFSGGSRKDCRILAIKKFSALFPELEKQPGKQATCR